MLKRIYLSLLLCLSLLSGSSLYAQELQQAQQQYYFGFGPGFFSNLNSDKLATVITPGVMWTINSRFDLAVMSDIAFSLSHSDVRAISPQLKGRYIFIEEGDVGFYGGLGMGYGYASARPSGSASGFATSISAGIKAFRSSSVQLSVEIENNFIWSQSPHGTPHMTFLKVGVHFY